MVILQSPVEFVWDPLPEATVYEAKLYTSRRTERVAWPVDYKNTTQPTWTVQLEPNKPKVFYLLTLLAYQGDELVGALGADTHTGEGMFEFRVE